MRKFLSLLFALCQASIVWAAGPEGGVDSGRREGDNGGATTEGERPAAVAAAESRGYSLQISEHAGGGIKAVPEQSKYDPHTTVTLVAEPEPGYVFDRWAGDVKGTEASVNITMDSNKTIGAKFLPQAEGVIMEAADATLSGNWMFGSAKWGARNNYQFASTIKDASEGTVSTITYQPDLPKSGLYDIYLWYSQGTNRAPNAPWQISSKTGTVVVEVNQQNNGGNWRLLASGVEFESGNKGFVRLSNETGTPGYVVIADSIAFVSVSATP